ncbi:MAG TPA: L-threonylcarbamoyladenylate synthase [Mycobacteriales bacterium]
MSDWYNLADPDQRATGVNAARDALRRGDLVVLPTDTVYGVGADAFSPGAVRALLMAKGRGRDMPVPVLVGSWHTLEGLVSGVPKVVLGMVEAFWPGGLTIIVRHAPSLAWDLGDSHGTVAVRMPSHPAALELLAETGPMAVSSANRTGQPPAVTITLAREQFGEDVAVYLDDGPCADPVPSTIVDATGERVTVRRVGALPVARLREVVPDLLVPPELADRSAGSGQSSNGAGHSSGRPDQSEEHPSGGSG